MVNCYHVILLHICFGLVPKKDSAFCSFANLCTSKVLRKYFFFICFLCICAKYCFIQSEITVSDVSWFKRHILQETYFCLFSVTLKLDTVGSCCTLIAEELLEDPDFHLDDQVAQLLYGMRTLILY